MKSIQVLDCTLRDGGFANDWDFGIGSIKSIITRLNDARINIIELGWIDARRQFDKNRSIQPDTKSYQQMVEGLNINYSMLVGMIDYGTCPIENIQPASKSIFAGIRVIFKKKDADAAIEFCAKIKSLGYKIFIQPVSITGYTNSELQDLLVKIDTVRPYSVAIVDTYGLLHKEQLLHYFHLLDTCLSKESKIGYHSHNNFQLAYANSIELCNLSSNRELLVDATLYGMGKGAGNANTELVTMYLNENHGANYDINEIMEAIDVNILKEYKKKQWGYSFNYYISALNDCHPDYVKFLAEKKTLSVHAINRILENLPTLNKLSFDKDLITHLHAEYRDREYADDKSYSTLSDIIRGRKILVLAPGSSIDKQKDIIISFINEQNPLIISINYVFESITSDYVFFSNPKRFSQSFHNIVNNKAGVAGIILTSNIDVMHDPVELIFDFASIKYDSELIADNPMLLMLKILSKINLSEVYVAGFDGYQGKFIENYLGDYVELLYCDDNVYLRNTEIKKALVKLTENMQINTLTDSIYFNLGDG